MIFIYIYLIRDQWPLINIELFYFNILLQYQYLTLSLFKPFGYQ